MTFAGNERQLKADQFTELNLAICCTEQGAPGVASVPLTVRRRVINYGSSHVMERRSTVLGYGLSAVYPGFLTVPYEIVAFSNQPMRSFAYDLVEAGNAPLRQHLTTDTVLPRGRMIDTSTDIGGLGFVAPAVEVPSFLSALMGDVDAPAAGPGASGNNEEDEAGE